jgi:hypothetical protein
MGQGYLDYVASVTDPSTVIVGVKEKMNDPSVSTAPTPGTNAEALVLWGVENFLPTFGLPAYEGLS